MRPGGAVWSMASPAGPSRVTSCVLQWHNAPVNFRRVETTTPKRHRLTGCRNFKS